MRARALERGERRRNCVLKVLGGLGGGPGARGERPGREGRALPCRRLSPLGDLAKAQSHFFRRGDGQMYGEKSGSFPSRRETEFSEKPLP